MVAIPLGYYLASSFLQFLINSINNRFTLDVITLSAGESLNTVILMSLGVIILIYIPLLVIMFYIKWQSALYENEKRIIRWAWLPMLFGAGGAVVGFWVSVNMFLPYFFSYNMGLDIKNTITISSLIWFIVQNMIIFCLIAQMPIVLKLLVKNKIVSKSRLRSYWKPVIFVSFIIAGLITPPDFLSIFIVGVPLSLSYFVALI